MKPFLTTAAVAVALLAAAGAMAGERTVTLRVDNMYCPTCPFIVQRSLEKVAGVLEVKVSYEEKTAVVTFDESETDVGALTAATTEAGYPSRPLAADRGE